MDIPRGHRLSGIYIPRVAINTLFNEGVCNNRFIIFYSANIEYRMIMISLIYTNVKHSVHNNSDLFRRPVSSQGYLLTMFTVQL